MRDRSFHNKKDGRVFQMLDGFSMKPMVFAEGKHNYTRRNLDSLMAGQSMTFMPMFGNRNPVYTTVTRIK